MLSTESRTVRIGLALTLIALACPGQVIRTVSASAAAQSASTRQALLQEFGYEIPACSSAPGLYAYKYRETGEYRHIEHSLSLELFNDGKFVMSNSFDNTTAPDKFATASFSGYWMEYAGQRGRSIKLVFNRGVDGEVWTLSRFIGRIKSGNIVDMDLETFGSDGIRVFSQIARREEKSDQYCSQRGPAVDVFVANLQNDKAWQATKVGFTGDVRAHLTLALEADRVFGGSKAIVLDTIAALYALTNDFGKAVETESKALRLIRSVPEPTDGDKETIKKFEDRLTLYQRGQPYRQ